MHVTWGFSRVVGILLLQVRYYDLWVYCRFRFGMALTVGFVFYRASRAVTARKNIATLSWGPWRMHVRSTRAPSKLEGEKRCVRGGDSTCSFFSFHVLGLHSSDVQAHKDSIEVTGRNKSENKSFAEAWRFFFLAGTAMSNLYGCIVMRTVAFRARSYMMCRRGASLASLLSARSAPGTGSRLGERTSP